MVDELGKYKKDPNGRTRTRSNTVRTGQMTLLAVKQVISVQY